MVVLRPTSSEATMTQPAVVRVINHLAAKHTWLSADRHSTIPRSTCHTDDALSCPPSSERLRIPHVSLPTSNHSAHTHTETVTHQLLLHTALIYCGCKHSHDTRLYVLQDTHRLTPINFSSTPLSSTAAVNTLA